MRRVLRFNIANRERGKRNWERQLRVEGRGSVAQLEGNVIE
jgi:hypothetical protein